MDLHVERSPTAVLIISRNNEDLTNDEAATLYHLRISRWHALHDLDKSGLATHLVKGVVIEEESLFPDGAR